MITFCLVNICSKIFQRLKILWLLMQKMWQNLQKWSISLLNVPSKILNILFHLPKDIFCIDSRRIFKHMKILEDLCLSMVKSSKKNFITVKLEKITPQIISVKLRNCYICYLKKLLQSAAVHIILQIGKTYIVRFCMDLKVSHHRCTRGAGKQCSNCRQLLIQFD